MNFEEWIVLRCTNIHTHNLLWKKWHRWTNDVQIIYFIIIRRRSKKHWMFRKGENKTTEWQTNTDNISIFPYWEVHEKLWSHNGRWAFFQQKIIFFFRTNYQEENDPNDIVQETCLCGPSWYESVLVQRETNPK